MRNIHRTSHFKKDIKKAIKAGKDLPRLKEVIQTLVNRKTLPEIYKDHKLNGHYDDCRECHIQPDWLLIYQSSDNTLTLIRCGSHSELFK
ncbi:MAG: type II toxin-antitoxin system YafQ family toxin [Candidatus Marinimicrobia bacterium]|nr:type II toxin-antitoxin system YafQ family toxin [Candidatus Neomarinimicrobiota bacterium]